MKKNVLICVIALLTALPAVASAEMTVDEIVAANLEAKGGKEAWEALKSGRVQGTMRVEGGPAGAMEMPFTVEFKKPEKIRVEFTMQGMTAIQAYDGEIGWSIMPFMGKTEPEEMAEDQVKQIKNQAEFEGVLVNYKEKGHTVEYLGTEEVDGTPAYKLRVTRADGDVSTLYLDQEYFIEFKMDTTQEIQGNEITVSAILGDYKEVDGLLFAHSMEMSMGDSGARQVITLDTIELNIDLPDDHFAMPAKTETDSGADAESAE